MYSGQNSNTQISRSYEDFELQESLCPRLLLNPSLGNRACRKLVGPNMNSNIYGMVILSNRNLPKTGLPFRSLSKVTILRKYIVKHKTLHVMGT